jgi:glycosyltransferase involved in cell wall biosynthesis
MDGVKPIEVQQLNQSAKSRILLLVTQADWGGVQSFLVRFAARLMAEGHQVLLAGGGQGELWKNAEVQGIPTRKIASLVREISPVKDLKAIHEIKMLIESFKPDAIHLNSSKMGVIGSIAARYSKTKPRVVYRIGGWVFLEPISAWRKWLYRTAEKLTARFKDVIITVHPGDEALAKTLGIRPREKTITVQNGLDLDEFAAKLEPRQAARSSLGLPESGFVFGTVANAYATKGLIPYLDSVKTICDANPDAHFVVIGDGPELEELKAKQIRLALDRLFLAGHRDDAGRLYQAFDAFVLPSRKEGMPWTVLEAMAAGIPIVATDVGACRWMTHDATLGEAALIVPPEDAPALEAALKKLAQDAELRLKLAQAGTKIVCHCFSWDKTYRGNRDALQG